MPLEKIDNDGNYTHFPGFTVVAAISQADQPFWKRIYACIAECDSGRLYYSPLPLESYHMTAINLFTEQQDGGKDWEGFIEKKIPFFQRLSAVLAEKKISPCITIEEVIFSGVIQLAVQLPVEQEAIIRGIAQEFKIEHLVPSAFHITLAYQYRRFPDRATFELIKTQMESAIRGVLQDSPEELFLAPPKLCSFQDMTMFSPWENIGLHSGREQGLFGLSQPRSLLSSESSPSKPSSRPS